MTGSHSRVVDEGCGVEPVLRGRDERFSLYFWSLEEDRRFRALD